MDKLLKQVEQMDGDEVENLRRLLQERSGGGGSGAETRETRDPQKDGVGWMYKEDRPDRDEYLLGRRVDRHIEAETAPPEDKNAPGASFSEVIARRADIDMHAKMREDPLYAIRKQEEDSRRKLLANPIKMKQLEKLIKEKEKMSKKKDKKKKKKKIRDDDSSDDSGDELLDKFLEIRRQKELKVLKRSGEYVSDIDRRKDKHEKKDRRKDKHEKRSVRGESRERAIHSRSETDQRPARDRSDTDHKHTRRQSETDHRPARDRSDTGHRLARDRSDTGHKHTRRHTSSHSEDEYGHSAAKNYGLVTREGKPVKPRRRSSRSRSRSRSPRRSNDEKKHSKRVLSPPRKKEKLSREEMDRRRTEMMENAQVRDREREDNIKRYKAEADREKDQYEKQGSASDFLNPLLMKHADNASVEERIKRNKYNVQRTRADLDKNFTRR